MAEKSQRVVDDDLESHIYDTINRLERLATRLDAFANHEEETTDESNSRHKR